jgi:hypothetical protein
MKRWVLDKPCLQVVNREPILKAAAAVPRRRMKKLLGVVMVRGHLRWAFHQYR